MDRYVDGYVLPVPTDDLDAYCEMAGEAGERWIEHGSLEYFEGVGDDMEPDVGDEPTLSFPGLADAGPDEAVVFAFAVYESREHRDEVNAKVMEEMEGWTRRRPLTCPSIRPGWPTAASSLSSVTKADRATARSVTDWPRN